MRTVCDQIRDHLGRQQQVHRLRIVRQVAQARIGPRRLPQLLYRGSDQHRITEQRNRIRCFTIGAQTDLQSPERHHVIGIGIGLAERDIALGLQQPQHQLGLVPGQTRPPAFQRLGQLMAAAIQGDVIDECGHQRMRRRWWIQQLPDDRIGEFGHHILEQHARLPRDAQCGRHGHRQFREPCTLPLATDQPPAHPPLPVVAAQFWRHPAGPHPPLDPVRHMREKP